MKTDHIYTLALKYLARRSRTVKEMHQYLNKKTKNQKKITQIIDQLLDLGYLDDYIFARQFIDNRIRFKPKSIYALGFELRQKGIAPDMVDEIVSSLDNRMLARSAIQLKAAQWSHLDRDTQKKKVMNYLRYRGFDYGVCRDVWEQFFKRL